ncbi:MAG: hypothetical protein ACRDWI_14275 [Jiangellaceae bacterium]
MIVAAILVSEVAFWVFLAAGLAARYVARRPILGLVLLLGSPVADVALLTLTAVDLHRGAAPTQAHALAAAYIGFTVAFGHSVVRWADRRLAQRFAGGAPAAKPQRTGPERVRHEWREFRRAALFWAVSGGLLLVLSALVGDVERAQPLLGYVGVLTLVLGTWFVAGPVATSIAVARTPSHPGRHHPKEEAA